MTGDRPLHEVVVDVMTLPPEQSREEIGEYYLNARVGDIAIIRDTYWGGLCYTTTVIKDIKPPRLYVEDPPGYGGPAFYIKSGQNCRAPHGKASLVAPTPYILHWQKKYPDGRKNYEFTVAGESGLRWHPRRIAS
jgi:hypothetical protein